MKSLLLLLVAGPLAAADKPDAGAQKTAASETATKLKFKVQIVETADLVICAELPEVKAKALTEAAQKAVGVARTALQFEKDELLFSGAKLTVYAFMDHAHLKLFVREVERRRPEADAFSSSLRGSLPHVAVSPDAGAKPVEADVIAAAASRAAAATLHQKLGVVGDPPPDWLLAGFGRACYLRGESNVRQAPVRQRIKALVASKTKPISAKDLWSGAAVAERDLVAGSFVEFLAFGPYSEKFLAFTKAMKPPADSDTGPNVEEAFKSYEMTADQLDLAWKTWIIKGK